MSPSEQLQSGSGQTITGAAGRNREEVTSRTKRNGENSIMHAKELNNAAVDAVKEGKKEEAALCFEQALKDDPCQVEATYNNGLLRWRSGQQDCNEFIESLSEIAKQYPLNPKIPYLIGCVELESFNYQCAFENFQKAKKLGFTDNEIENHLSALQSSSNIEKRVVHEHRLNNEELTCQPTLSLRAAEFAYADSNGDVHVFDARDGHRITCISFGEGNIDAIALSPEGQRIAVIKSYTLYLWDISAGELKWSEPLRGGRRKLSLAFAPDGGHILCSGFCGIEKVNMVVEILVLTELAVYEYDAETSEHKSVMTLHDIFEGEAKDQISSAYSPDSQDRIFIKKGLRLNSGISDTNGEHYCESVTSSNRDGDFKRKELVYWTDAGYAFLLPPRASRERLKLFHVPTGRCVWVDGLIFSWTTGSPCFCIDSWAGVVTIREMSSEPLKIVSAPWCYCDVPSPEIQVQNEQKHLNTLRPSSGQNRAAASAAAPLRAMAT